MSDDTTGDVEAAFALYWAYAKGQGVNRDVERAMDVLRKAAELGHAPAQAQLAREIYGQSKDEALGHRAPSAAMQLIRAGCRSRR